MIGADIGDELRDAIRSALASRTQLAIEGGGSKHFYGRLPEGKALTVGRHRGIIAHEPAELSVTVRSGTRLHELEAALAKHGQMLPFEPPRHSPAATVGGAIATGLAGPRRMQAGSVRDALLGIGCISGEGRMLRFGGRVMKNVAGFDAFRLMAGAMGTLAVLLDATFRLLPCPEARTTTTFACSAGEAIARMRDWARLPLPVTGTAWLEGRLYARLEGNEAAVRAGHATLGGDPLTPDGSWWESVRDQQHPWFQKPGLLWRLALPPATPPLPIVGDWLIEWGGGQRWLRTAMAPKFVRETCARAGGHATMFHTEDRAGDVFHPLSPTVLAIHRRLKEAFDPRGILNPRRMYREF